MKLKPRYRVLRVIPSFDDQALERFLNDLKRPLLSLIDRGDYLLLICGEESERGSNENEKG